jgi:hypothetical protein
MSNLPGWRGDCGLSALVDLNDGDANLRRQLLPVGRALWQQAIAIFPNIIARGKTMIHMRWSAYTEHIRTLLL